jgi:hypothetical protein
MKCLCSPESNAPWNHESVFHIYFPLGLNCHVEENLMDANIQQQAKRKAPGEPTVKPKVRGAMGFELRATIAKAKAEAMRELEGIDYTQAPRDPKEEPLKIWKRPPVRRECCHVRQPPTNSITLG